jgi:hypothetical protein
MEDFLVFISNQLLSLVFSHIEKDIYSSFFHDEKKLYYSIKFDLIVVAACPH